MWLITGPFDNDTQTDIIPDKTKLLKSATTYPIGRQKESALRINHKKVSRNNGEIIIGEHTVDDVTNPAVVPTLTFRNTRDSGIRVTRGDKSFIVLANSDRGLESGDLVRLAAGVTFTVLWRPIVCFNSNEESTSTVDNTACASLGVKLTTKHTRDITHYLTPSISSPLHGTILLSLLNQAMIVTPHWFSTLLGSEDALCQTYEPISETDYIPHIDPKLLTIHQNPKLLSPNEMRKGFFENITFVFTVIGSGIGTETKAMADVVIRGGGQRSLVDVEKEAKDTSKNAWDTLLKKKTHLIREGMGSGLVLVGEDGKMRERGVPKDIKKTWEAMLEKARIEGLRIIHPSAVSEAILNTNLSLIDCTVLSNEEQGQSTHMQEDEPPQRQAVSTADNEPSQQIEPSSSRPLRKLTRRAASKPPIDVPAPSSPPPAAAPVQEPSTSAVEDKPRQEPESEIEEVPQPKKKVLKRRAKTTGLVNALLGIDHASIEDHSSSLVPQDAVEVVVANVPIPSSPGGEPPVSQLRRPLKRRARGNSQSQFTIPLETEDDNGMKAPQSKKFKALFEESGRGEIQSLPVEESEETPGVSGGSQHMNLEALREEEEETQPQFQSHPPDKRPPLNRKRKLVSIEEEEEASQDVEMEEYQQPSKKRAIEGNNAIDHSQDLLQINANAPGSSEINTNDRINDAIQPLPNKKTKAKGAAPGKPDTDPSFLMAMASLKRGKRTEDDFDREFNQLRISKPKLADGGSKENEAPWNLNGVDDFERDIGIRGNFMQIVEMDVWRGNQSRSQRSSERYQGERVDWEGRQNFKKFKKNVKNREREIIPLVATSSESFVGEPSIDYRPHARPVARRAAPKKAPIVLAEDFDDVDEHEEEGHPVLTNKNKFVTARQRAPPARTRDKPPSTSNRKVSQATIVDDDEEEDGIRTLSGRSGRSLQKTNTQPVASSSKNISEPLFVDDSEDEIEHVALPRRTLRSTQSQSQSQSQSQDVMDIDETLKSDPKGASQPQTTTKGRKRKLSPVPVEDDDDDGGGTFGGFSRRGAAKRRK
ncbi:hypothetical protein Clacol_008538 [Clathrus columnatus]|uniref:Nibrin n=1 Tax=Clathrus columnatus TaxID=1419009 RepID=A0AAV5ANN3_9AGAM|nr:hypothetical protein Clacol_008538 [Clathrus columnatus]